MQVLAARRRGVRERYIDTNGPGGLVFAPRRAVSSHAPTLAAGYEQVNGAAVICGFAAALCVRSADLTSQSIRRAAAHGNPGRRGAIRDTLTADTLHADKDTAALDLGDDHAAEIIDRQAALLDGLPAGFRIERTRATASRPVATRAWSSA